MVDNCLNHESYAGMWREVYRNNEPLFYDKKYRRHLIVEREALSLPIKWCDEKFKEMFMMQEKGISDNPYFKEKMRRDKIYNAGLRMDYSRKDDRDKINDLLYRRHRTNATKNMANVYRRNLLIEISEETLRSKVKFGLYNGEGFLSAGYVYVPYVSLAMAQPVLIDRSSFNPRKGLMTRYSKKMVNNKFYGNVNLGDL